MPFGLAIAYFGSTLEQYVLFFGAIALSVLATKAIYFVVKKYGGIIAERTATKLDNMLLEAMEAPVLFAGFIAGLIIGYQFLTPDVEFVKNNFRNAVNALIIVNLTWLALKLVDCAIDYFIIPLSSRTKSMIDNHLLPVLRNVTKFSIVCLGLVIILSTFGVDVLPLLAGLGLGGLVIAFAAQKTVEDVFGGLSIYFSKPFVVGDTVRVKGIEGSVQSVGMRYTRIMDGDGRLITIPNGQVAQDVIMNISSERMRKVQVMLALKYGTSAKKVEEALGILREIAKSSSETDHESSRITAVFRGYMPSGLELLFSFYVKNAGKALDATSEINLEIKRRFEKAGIEFASYPSQGIFVEKKPNGKK